MLFHYKARNVDGIESLGTLDAVDERSALAELTNRGLLVTKVSRNAPGGFGLDSDIQFLSWVPAKLFHAFLLQLSVMIRAGIPLSEALASLEGGENHKYFKKILAAIRKDVEQGKPFSEALVSHPNVFDAFFVNMIRIGETGGVLDKVLIKLASIQQRSLALRNQVIGAVAYPALLVSITFCVLLLLFGFALPRFAEMFKQANFPLPLPTRIVLGVGEFVGGHLRLFFGMGLGAAALAVLAVVTTVGRMLAGELFLRVPVFGEVVRNYLVVHISDSLSMLLGAGVPLLELLGSVEGTLGMPTARRTLESMRSFVERGSTLRLSLEGNIVFPAMALKLIETGEKTGTLDKMFGEIATFYDDVLQSSVKAALSLLEPLLIFFMAGIVGFIMLSVILPIFQMSQLMRGGPG